VLSFFPYPYPDELLYSVFARFYIRSGNLSYKTTIKELFNTNNITPTIDMPCHLSALINNLPNGYNNLSEDFLIRNHTLSSFYCAFLPEERVKRVLLSHKGNYGGDIHLVTGITAGTIPKLSHLRYCPDCNKQDFERYGEYYWHRLHQIPGALLCNKHKTILRNSQIKIDLLGKQYLITADRENCPLQVKPEKFSEQIYEKLSMLTDIVSDLFDFYSQIRDLMKNLSNIRDIYQSALMEKGLCTLNGCLRLNSIRDSFLSFYGIEFLKIIKVDVDFNSAHNWLFSIFRKHRKSFHPLKHILAIGFLFRTLEDFIKADYEFLPFGKSLWPCLNKVCKHYRKPVISDIRISICSDTRKPVGHFKCSCGFAYSRRGPDCNEEDRYRIGRIESFGEVWQKKLNELSHNKNLSLRKIAHIMGVDTNTVKKYSNSTIHIKCRQNSDLIQYDLENRKKEARKKWKQIQAQYPNLSKTKLRQIAQNVYITLYRYDREWLIKNSPIKQTRTLKNRIDWETRDRETLSLLKITVNKLIRLEGKPIRLTISLIAQKCGKRSWIQKHPDKMQLCMSYLSSVVDTKDSYQIKRIKWAAKELDNSGVLPVRWKVVRMAGLRPDISKPVEDVLEMTVNQFNQLCVNRTKSKEIKDEAICS
jgi:hypothetical protein